MLFFALLAGVASAQPDLQGLQRRVIDGQDYVRLTDWARAAEFEMRSDQSILQLSGRWSKLILNVNLRRASINDVTVFLSWPVVVHDGAPYIAALDLKKTVHPVLFPPKYSHGARIRTICLDPGHGGSDPGNVEGPFREKQLTLLLAHSLAAQLKQAGFHVVFTRQNDEFVGLLDRPEIARRQAADLFISLHYNAANQTTVSGIEIYCMPPAGASSTSGDHSRLHPANGNQHDEQNMLLAYQIQRAMLGRLQAADRGVRRGRYAVLREAAMPAVLIEAGFMSNPAERSFMSDQDHRQKTARAIVEGIIAYQRLVER